MSNEFLFERKRHSPGDSRANVSVLEDPLAGVEGEIDKRITTILLDPYDDYADKKKSLLYWLDKAGYDTDTIRISASAKEKR